MNRYFHGVALGLILVGMPSCKFVDGLISGNSGPADVTDLVEAAEAVGGEIDASKQSMLSAVQALQKVTAPDFEGDAVKAHEELEDAIDSSDDQANDLRRSIEKMQAAAEPVFDQWTKDLEAYSNPEMRQRTCSLKLFRPSTSSIQWQLSSPLKIASDMSWSSPTRSAAPTRPETP